MTFRIIITEKLQVSGTVPLFEQWRRSRSGRSGGRRTNIFAKKKKKKKTSVSLEDYFSFLRGLSSVVCLSWKIQSIEKRWRDQLDIDQLGNAFVDRRPGGSILSFDTILS